MHRWGHQVEWNWTTSSKIKGKDRLTEACEWEYLWCNQQHFGDSHSKKPKWPIVYGLYGHMATTSRMIKW